MGVKIAKFIFKKCVVINCLPNLLGTNEPPLIKVGQVKNGSFEIT
jgi:hypothetical protein